MNSNINTSLVLIIIILIVLFILWFSYHHSFKKIVCGAINLITGAVKAGKSLLCVELSILDYKRRHLKWWISTTIFKKDIEEPMYYTNVVISFKNWQNSDNIEDCKRKPHKLDKNICYITKDILLRQKRFAYKSVFYIQEASLCADSQEFTDKVRNATLSMFNKLFAHEGKGSVLYYDTQSVCDLHYSIKRVVGSYFYIQKTRNFFFFRVLYIREMVNGEALTSTVNTVTDDIDFSVRKYIIWRRFYKKYDRYYYSYMTDDLEVSKERFQYRKGFISFSPIYNDFASGMTFEAVSKKESDRRIRDSLELYKSKQAYKKQLEMEEYL